MARGWFGQPYRHGLAAKGIKSGRISVKVRNSKEVREWSKQYKKRLAGGGGGNPVEVRGQQLRIRVLKPKERARYRVHDVGRRGRLQLTLMDGDVQSYAMNLDDYETRDMALFEINHLNLTSYQKAEAVRMANQYYDGKK